MKKLIIDNGNGESKIIRIRTLIVVLITLLFGTNLVGSFFATYLRSANIRSELERVTTQAEKNTQMIIDNAKMVVILQTKLEMLTDGQKEIKTILLTKAKADE